MTTVILLPNECIKPAEEEPDVKDAGVGVLNKERYGDCERKIIEAAPLFGGTVSKLKEDPASLKKLVWHHQVT
jgi:hypothetical protein